MKAKIVYILCGIMFMLIGYVSCRHNPDIPDSPQVSYTDKIKPIIDANCARSGCHGGADPEEFSLETYNELMSLVVAGNAHKSELYKVVTKLSGNNMPPDHPLSEQQIILIYTWIMQGAKNN